jgi:hypothetical protein
MTFDTNANMPISTVTTFCVGLTLEQAWMDTTTMMPLERELPSLLLILGFDQHTKNFRVALRVAQTSVPKVVQLLVSMEHMLVSLRMALG